jgi:Glycosyl hydrolases family 16
MPDISDEHRERTRRLESSQDFLAHRQAPHRRLSRRSVLGWSAAATFAAAAGVFTAFTAPDEDASRGHILFSDVFAGHLLSRNHWNPYICDTNSNGRPWLTQSSVAVGSSAIGPENGRQAEYDLPSAIRVGDGLTLTTYRGTRAVGYSWTGSVICSRPTSNNFGSGTVHTAGFTFTDARVEVRAKMPDLTGGQWPAIWFLPAWANDGAEIDLFEGGFLSRAISPNQLMAVDLQSDGNQQQFLDCRTDLSAGYHTYSMEYRQGSSIRVFFDDSNVYTYTRNVPVGPYFIILSNSIASAHTASWHTQVSNSTPAINLMHVSNVRVREL